MPSLSQTILFLILSNVAILGQNEQVTITNSEEEMDTVKFSKLLKTYNQIIRAQQEELSIFKIDLLGPLLYGMSNWGPENDTVKNHILRLVEIPHQRPECCFARS